MNSVSKKNKYEIDMCNGSIMDKLISFSLPLMLSGILQLMFNAVDIVVVGRFSGSQALAAVGSTTSLINMFTNLFIGVSLGANVLAARFYASGRSKEMSETVHTSITFALISGIVMVFAGLFFSRFALELMATPSDVIDQSALYMKIYFLGMPFFMLYNYGAAILRAVGDTKRPLFFLIAAGLINAGLNMVLVIVFNMGVAGVAIATVISQMVSCILVLRCLYQSDSSYQLRVSKLTLKKHHLKQIFQVGIPAGIQSTVINFSNVLLQSSVNSFGSIAMAGYTAANNIFGFLFVAVNSVTQACMSFTSQNFGVGKWKRMDKVLIAMAGYTAANNIFGFLFVAVNSVTQACMSFTSQNFGVGKWKRMDKVLVDCMILSVTVAVLLGGGAYVFGPELLQIYTKDPQVIQCGVEILLYTTVTYFLCGLMDLFPGALRGMGHSAVPMFLSVIGTVGTRIIWIFWVFPQHRSLDWLFGMGHSAVPMFLSVIGTVGTRIIWIFWVFPQHRSLDWLFISYPASWIATIVLQVLCFWFVRKSVHRKLKAGEEQ